jgi:VWFA-related protein
MAKIVKFRTVVVLLALLVCLELFVGITSGKTRQTKQQQPPKTDKPAQTNQPNQKGQEEVVPTLATELVQLDAVISDKSGKLITTLKKEDFEVLEDGKPQQLSFFAAENHTPIDDLKNIDLTKRGETLDKQGTPSTIDSGRVILIVFDNLHMDASSTMRARQALLRFVDDNVLDGDRAAILTTAGGYGILQQLTGDKVVMKAAINRLTSGRTGNGSDDAQNPRITEYHAQLIQAGDRDVLDATIRATIKAEHLDGLPHPEQIAYGIVQGRVSRIMGLSRAYGLATLDTLQNAIKAMKSIKGRKMAVFVSDGFPVLASELTSKITDITDAATRAGVVV